MKKLQEQPLNRIISMVHRDSVTSIKSDTADTLRLNPDYDDDIDLEDDEPIEDYCDWCGILNCMGACVNDY